MRLKVLTALAALIVSTAAALAQQPARTSDQRGSTTRDEFVARAVERAKQQAGQRFDAMDTNHDGVLSAEERRAARARATGNPKPQDDD